MAKNRLSIIVLGNNHADLTPYSVLTRLFEKLSKRNIPCAFKAEGPSDETLVDAMNSTQRGLRQTQLVKTLAPELQSLYTTHKQSKRKYLKLSAWDAVEKAVDAKFMPILPPAMQNKGTLKSVVLDIFRENAYVEELKLLQRLEELRIPFAGIETDTATYNQYMVASAASDDSYYDNELRRIGYMVNHIMPDALERFSEGGIVFVFTGRNHAHRLAANLLHRVRTESFESKDIDFYAFNLCSSYVKEGNGYHDHALEFTASLDSSDIKSTYEVLPCPTLECEESDTFRFPELETLVDALIQNFKMIKAPSSSIFASLPPHDQLVSDIKKYVNQYPQHVSSTFVTQIETNRNYSLALRNACAWGNGVLVKLIIKYSDVLPINFNQTSSNGKTPLKWFETSDADITIKNEIIPLLQEKMNLENTLQFNT